MTQYNPNASAQENEFKSVTTILDDAKALIATGEFENAVNRIGHALAAAQAAMYMQEQRDGAALDVSVKVKRIADANSYLYQLTKKALPEAMDVTTFYNQNKPFDLSK